MAKRIISEEDDIEIFKMRGDGAKYREIATHYNVKCSTIGQHLQNFEIKLAIESEKTSVVEVAKIYNISESQVSLAHAYHKFRKHL